MVRSLLILPLSALLAATGAAQTDPGAAAAPSLDALIAEALAKSPALAAARSRTAAARELERPAATLPDPMLEAMVQNADFPDYTIGTMDMSMAGLEVRQPLPYPGKLRARAAAARAETVLREAEVEELERRIVAEVRRLYGRLYALDAEQQVLDAARDLTALLTATARARYAAAAGDAGDLLKAQLEETRLAERLEDHHSERHAMVADLNRWLGRPGDAPLGVVGELPAAPAPQGSWEDLAAAGSPRVRTARAALRLGEEQLGAARLDLRPDLSPAAGLAFRGPLGPVLTLRFGVEWPLWRSRKQEPRVRAAEQEAERARQDLRDAEIEARAAAAHLRYQWENATSQILRYREGILPQSTAVLDAARASYLAGRGDFSAVAEGFDTWLEARMQLARREADRFAAWAAFSALAGGES
jgi:outer membrane protein TolC